MVSSTGTFVSCKDYDDDIDNINKELSTLKGDLSALQAKVNEGKWITSLAPTTGGFYRNIFRITLLIPLRMVKMVLLVLML